jgi:hypothetical protein
MERAREIDSERERERESEREYACACRLTAGKPDVTESRERIIS